MLTPDEVEGPRPLAFGVQLLLGAVATLPVSYLVSIEESLDPLIVIPTVVGGVLFVLMRLLPWQPYQFAGLIFGAYLGLTLTVLLQPVEPDLVGVPRENVLGMSITSDQAALLTGGAVGGLVCVVLFITNLDVRSFVGGFPQLFPAALIVLLVPLFTTELWRLAASMGWWQFPPFVALLLTPVWLLACRRLRSATSDAFEEVGSELSDNPPTDELAKAVGRQTPDEAAEELAISAYGEPAAEVERISKALSSRFKRKIAVKLVPLTIAILLFSALFFYLLAVLLVDGPVAREWAGPAGASHPPEVARAGWQYAAVALVLGTAGAASFLALLTTDPQRTQAVTRALVHDPIRSCLILALPYRRLRQCGPDVASDRVDDRELTGAGAG